MLHSQATISTAYASRYLQQLTKHWAHKFETEFTPKSAKITLPLGDARLTASDTSLSIELTTHSDESEKQLQEVVQDHVERFAFKETLEFRWEPTT